VTDLFAGIEKAEVSAWVDAAAANESAILEHAQTLVLPVENAVAAALEGGFRAKVPLAGGSIAQAIGAAASTLEGEQATSLKALFDATLAQARAWVSQPG
jgi:hypothetical protein